MPQLSVVALLALLAVGFLLGSIRNNSLNAIVFKVAVSACCKRKELTLLAVIF